ncbi:MAG: (2Fe-2S)-binding protein [Chromatiales bacterium]|nr:(2Fe-2S)-binding protein [Chromatiales bacterium]
MSHATVEFRLNGRDRTELIDGGETLLSLLRHRLDITSLKQGCRQGTCGACTVIVDGEPRLACITLAATCGGRSIETAESLPGADGLHPLQRAFMDQFAAQCGFCTTGMLMAAKALLDGNPDPTREEVVDAIGGNICRCTGYEPIIEAILAAAGGAGARAQRSA